METTIVLLLFLLLALNPAMAIRYFWNFDFQSKRNIQGVKAVQAINAIITIALFVLVQILFENLAYGQAINW